MPQLALLGAAGTGKTRLSMELRVALTAAGGRDIGIADGPALPPDPLCRLDYPFEQTLLMGLDLPLPSAPFPERADQASSDSAIRNALAKGGIAYTVIYGVGPDRLKNALAALQIEVACSAADAPEQKSHKPSAWVWNCDSCSDPHCERRLLSDLLAQRA